MLGGGLLELAGGGRGRCGAVGDAEWLVGHRGPQEPDELAGDRDVRDGRAFPVVGEVSVAVIEPDLGVPGALVRRRAVASGAGERGGSATPASISSRRACLFPDRVMCPRCC